jgi:rubrerythrin
MFYEQMANMAKSERIRKVLFEIARKEKIHVAMLETVLLQTDREFLKIYADYALVKSRK